MRQWSALEQRGYRPLRGPEGLLQIAADEDEASAMAQSFASFVYPQDYVTSVSRDDAQHIANQRVARGGWFFPHGGWIDPASLCAAQCEAAGGLLERRFNVAAARVERVENQWIVFDANGIAIASAPVVVFANAHEAARIAGLRHAPTRSVRGQLTLLPASLAKEAANALRVPVIGEGYAVPLPDGVTLTGATYDIDDPDTSMRDDAHVENIERLAQMLPDIREAIGMRAPSSLAGRVAFRCVTSDRLPMIGAFANETAAIHQAGKLRGAWPLDLPRAQGLYGAFAFGSRGLVWASLGAELIASQIEGEPWPIERDLAEALDPARFLLRALRQGTAR